MDFSKVVNRKTDRLVFVIGYLSFAIKDLLIMLDPQVERNLLPGTFGILQITAFLYLACRNGFRISKNGMGFIFVVSLLFLWNVLLFHNHADMIELMSNEALLGGYAVMLYFMTERDGAFIMKSIRTVAYLMIFHYLIKYFAGMIVDEYGLFSYMGFGYGVAPFVAIVMQKSFMQKKKRDIALTVLMTGLVLLSANRGAILQLSLCIVIFFSLYTTRRRKFAYVSAIVAVVFLVIMFIGPILSVVQHFSDSLNLEETIFIRIETGEFGMSSGRDIIFRNILEYIKQRPILGYGVGADRYFLGGYYVHNIFLELWIDFGLILGSALLYKILKPGFTSYFTKPRSVWDDVFVVVFIPIVVMLLISNSLYNTHLFWELMGLSCAYNRCKRYSHSKTPSQIRLLNNKMLKRKGLQ